LHCVRDYDRTLSESAAVTLPESDLPLGLGGGRIELPFELRGNAFEVRHHVAALPIPRILVLEDEPLIAMMMRDWLAERLRRSSWIPVIVDPP
jgi:hypothetical protein